jgi:branched-chain amino acid transport system substrate-binding protein
LAGLSATQANKVFAFKESNRYQQLIQEAKMSLTNRPGVSAAVVALLAAATALAGCGGSAGVSSNNGPLVVGMLTSFTGVNASYGTDVMAGCVPAANVINAAGGVLGHKVTCQKFDDVSDPTDAIPETRKMLSTVPNLEMALGTGSDTSAAVVPIVNAAHIPIFPSSGQALFDVNQYPYFWRIVPIDAAQGYAMAIAASLHFKRIAAVFANTVSGLGSQPDFLIGLRKLHDPAVTNIVLPASQPSYKSVIVRIMRSHPQVIVGELDAATAATFYTDFLQLEGHLIPTITDGIATEVAWQQAVVKAIGRSHLSQISAVLPQTDFTSPGFLAFKNAVLSSNVPNKSTYATGVYAASFYDSVILVNLAALKARSISPSVYNRYIGEIANGVPGAVVVHTFAAGKKALADGKMIHYVGASGLISFSKYHNWEPPYDLSRFNNDGSTTTLQTVPQTSLQQLIASSKH